MLIIVELIKKINLLLENVITYTLIKKNKRKKANSPECKNCCPEKFMNLDLATVIENILRDTGLYGTLN